MTAGAATTGEEDEAGTVWSVSVVVAADRAGVFEDALAALDGAVSSTEIEEGRAWRVTLYCETPIDPAVIDPLLADAAVAAGVAPPRAEMGTIARTDWVAYVEERSPPLEAGRFYIFGSHVRTPPPAHLLPIRIDAGMAFGSGTHETTHGCLVALSRIVDTRPVRCALDMGTGSGILAIGIAKRWPEARVIACDNDSAAVAIARENAAANAVGDRVEAVAGDGYATARVIDAAPYDVIVANILAGPLIDMAPALARALAPGGIAILSGLLDEQADAVAAAHAAVGLVETGSTASGRWVVLEFRREPGR